MDATDRPNIVEYAHESIFFTVYDVKWVPKSARFVILGSNARGTGAIHVRKLGAPGIEKISQHEKQFAFRCGTFAGSQLRDRFLATGDYDGRISLWDLDNMLMPVYSAKKHTGIINCIDGCAGQGIGAGAPEYATGGQDGIVNLWDPRQKDKPVLSLKPDDGAEKRDCWAVAFGNAFQADDRVLAAGYDNGDVKLVDLRANALLWETNMKNGVCGLEFDRKDIQMNKMAVTCLESKFSVFDMRTYNAQAGYASLETAAHKSTIWSARHLPSNRDIFMTTGGNGSVFLWKYGYPPERTKNTEGGPVGVPGTCELLNDTILSTQPISSFDWHREKEGMFVCGSFDQCVRVGIVTKLKQYW